MAMTPENREQPAPPVTPGSSTSTEGHSGAAPRPRQDIPPELGRFVVLGRLGAGGMGVVYAAYDPELDRKVAVKLLHPRLTGSEKQDLGRARLLREAQAMAQLSHPNVVTLFDVGTYGDQIFIAMEFVQGLPLSEWLRRPHTWREVVAVFLAAGRGLAAAHRRGIVHGDFKPDNVIVDADGRARVLDFGLAFAQDRDEPRTGPAHNETHTRPGRSGALTGTPPYISPEQYLGDSASARTDQYAFCVSLHEGLYGARPYHGDDMQALRQAVLLASVPDEPRERRVPAWLRRILLRGMSRDPQQRFTDMPALLAELAHDRDRRRLLIGLGLASLVVLTAGALAYRWYLLGSYEAQQSARQGVCAGAARNLEGVWDAARRTEVAAAIRGTRLAYADDTWQRVAGRLDDYAAAWVAQHGDACQATYLRGEQSPALLDRRMACLHRAHTELRTFVDVLASADVSVVEHAAEATTKLPSLARCADIHALLAERPPLAPAEAAAQSQLRETLARVRARERTMQLKQGLALVVPALTQAQLLAERSLLAEAHLEHGKLLHFAGEHAASERALAEAFFAAEASRSDLVAAQAAIELVAGTMQQATPGAQPWSRHAQAQIDRLASDSPGDARRLQAGLAHALGTVQVHTGDHEQAKQSFLHALALLSASADDSMFRAALHNNLGNLEVRRGDLQAAEEQLGRASALYIAELGEHHPSVAVALNNLGEVQMRRGQLPEAQRSYTRAHAIFVAGLGEQHPNVGIVLNNLGDVLQRQGQPVAAEELYRRALAIFSASFGDQAPPLAYPLTGLGEALLAQGRGADALPRLEQALGLRDVGSPVELARTRFALARALWLHASDPPDRTRARDLAQLARDDLASAGQASARELREVLLWLGAHR